MRGAAIERTTMPDGSIRLSGKRCSFTFSFPGSGRLLVRIEGFDSGALGAAPLDELSAIVKSQEGLEIFVDASGAAGASWEVSESWTRFFRRNAPVLKRVHILAPSKFVHQTVSVAKLFSRTGDLIQVYSSPEVFRQLLPG